MRNNNSNHLAIDGEAEQPAQSIQPGPDDHSEGATAPSPRTLALMIQLLNEDSDADENDATASHNLSDPLEIVGHDTSYLYGTHQDSDSDAATGSDSDSDSDSRPDPTPYATLTTEQHPPRSYIGLSEIYDILYDNDSASEMSEADSPDTFPRCPALTPAQVERQIELARTNYRPHLWVTPLRPSDNNEPAEKNSGFDRDIARPA